jgi:hypothetical protein
MSLKLFETDFQLLNGEGPEVIQLKELTVIGRGSKSKTVDACIIARENG